MAEMDEALEAVRKGDAGALARLVHHNRALLITRTEQGATLLLLSVYHGKPEVTRVLLDAGVALDIFEAAALGKTMRIQEILGTDSSAVSAFSDEGWTALHLASFFGHAASAAALITAGADLEAVAKNAVANTPLQAACAANRVDCVGLLLDHGADVNAPGSASQWTPLHLAAHNGNLTVINLLLSAGASVTARSKDGKSALALALGAGHQEVVELLRTHGGAR